MTILHLPLNVPGSEQVGQENGFREVFEGYESFDYLKIAGDFGNDQANRALLARIDDLQPDVVWSQLQETNVITPETWQEIREKHPDIWLTTWSGDARTYVPPYLASILKYFDIFYNCTDQAMYKDFANRVEFMPIAVDPAEVTTFKEVSNVPAVVFIGNHYGMDAFPNSRNRFDTMVALSREFGNDFGVYGSGWPTGDINLLGPVEVKDQGSYYHAAKVVISMDHFNDMNYWSERRLWALASGSDVLMQLHPGFEEFEEFAYFFDSPSNCVSMAKLPLGANGIDHERARDFILNNHTWKQRAQQVRKDYEYAKSK